jgi:hypothetical protein
MMRWLLAILFIVVVASFAAWFSNRYLCDQMPEGSRICLGDNP